MCFKTSERHHDSPKLSHVVQKRGRSRTGRLVGGTEAGTVSGKGGSIGLVPQASGGLGPALKTWQPAGPAAGSLVNVPVICGPEEEFSVTQNLAPKTPKPFSVGQLVFSLASLSLSVHSPNLPLEGASTLLKLAMDCLPIILFSSSELRQTQIKRQLLVRYQAGAPRQREKAELIIQGHAEPHC